MYFEITFLAYFIDRVFGEFKYIKHPIIYMGDFITWFERRYYKDSILRGGILVLLLLSIVASITTLLDLLLPWWIIGVLSSMGIASKMLYDCVKDIITNPHDIKYLVSRDTENLSSSDINKAAIETYAENLSDGVIAPLFYLFLFGVVGLFVYKGINTLDSMVGYRNEKYENFGKISARCDDIANFIPARITALLISLLFFDHKALLKSFEYGSKHDSPNAGYPISAMAATLHLKLGGATSYFGKIKEKENFGDGRENITKKDLLAALAFQKRLDFFILLFAIFLLFHI